MNVVKEINKINEKELDLGLSGASWHDEYKNSAYIYVGGLSTDLTEGDVITIFSQYGEVMDVNIPRDKQTGKSRGFAFLMYEDQRSTVLAVDNLNGAKVLERTIRVDHVRDYKQPKVKDEDGEMRERDEPSMNAKPEMIIDGVDDSDSTASEGPNIDPEDPMAEYLLAQYNESKGKGKKDSGRKKRKRDNETPEERRQRKEAKRRKKESKESKRRLKTGLSLADDLMRSLQRQPEPVRSDSPPRRDHQRSPGLNGSSDVSRRHSRSQDSPRTPPTYRRRSRTPSPTPVRATEARRQWRRSPPPSSQDHFD